MMSTRPRRHSVVTLRLTVTADDVFSDENSPTLTPRNRSNPRGRPHHMPRTPTSPLPRTPSSPLHRTPPSPMHHRPPTSPVHRTPTSPHPPTSPLRMSQSPSPLSPRTGQFRYDANSGEGVTPGDHAHRDGNAGSLVSGCPPAHSSPAGLMRRSSLLTVPAMGGHDPLPCDQYLKPPRPRSSSLAGPLHTPDLLRYLMEVRERASGPLGTTSFSLDSSDGENSSDGEDTAVDEDIGRSSSRCSQRSQRSQRTAAGASPSPGQRNPPPPHHSQQYPYQQPQQSSSTAPHSGNRGRRPLHRSPHSCSYRSPSPHSPRRSPSPHRRNSAAAEGYNSVCRMRQFTTSKGRVVNKGDSIRPQRSGSNASMTSSVSSCSREFIYGCSTDSVTSPARTPNATTPNATTPNTNASPNHCTSPNSCTSPNPTSPNTYTPLASTTPRCGTPTTPPQHRVAMVGSTGVGRAALVTQFMTSEYMCAYDDSSEQGGSERSVSVMLDGEEAELMFSRDLDPEGLADKEAVDGWVVVYSVSDRPSFRDAALVLGKIWTSGYVSTRAVILVANKTDLERTRAVATSEGRTLAKTYECKFIEVSAGIDHNVDELLVGILAQIRLKQAHQMALSSRGRSAITSRLVRKLSSRVRGKGVRMPGIVGKLLNRDRKAKSCENLHIL